MGFSSNEAPRIAIIGAGPSGITAAKNLIQQGLMNFTVFEKGNQLGGNWVFDEHNTHSSVYETTHIISSKYLSEFEDYIMPPGYPDYPSHAQMLHYFNVYADNFQVRPHIQLNTCVLEAKPTPNGGWQLRYRNEEGVHEAFFDYLLVANGHHWDPYVPTYPGEFQGDILHSHQYKKAAFLKGKRVLVVGGGNSACDIAVEAARVSAKTCISMRRGQHIFPKFILGKATDIAFSKIDWLPFRCKQMITGVVMRFLQGHYGKYHLKKPKDRALTTHPTINSELFYFIRHGKIHPRVGIDHFDGHTVYFSDGRKDDFDVIIYASGYRTTFPFFSRELIDYSESTSIPLYLKMMHPELQSLYFIGLFQPQGCIWPLADYQAKIAAKIIAGSLKRPEDIQKRIEKDVKKSRKRFKESTRHALEVDYAIFRKELLAALR